jgi:hypothetical protein
MIVLKLSAKKFQFPGYPLTPFIATKFPESTLSLRNLRPIPGVRGAFKSVADGGAADDKRTIPESAP